MTLAIYYVITDSHPEWHFLGQLLKSPGSKVKYVDWYECPFDQRKIFSFGFALPHCQKKGKKQGRGWGTNEETILSCAGCVRISQPIVSIKLLCRLKNQRHF